MGGTPLRRTLLLLALVAACYLVLRKVGPRPYAIEVDGSPVVTVGSRRTAEELLTRIRQRAPDPQTAHFVENVTIRPVPAAGNQLTAEADALAMLTAKLTLLVPGAGIYANGRLVAGLPGREEAASALSLLLRELSPSDPDLTRAFKERVQVREGDIPLAQYLPSPQSVLALVRGAMAPAATYTVRRGDTASKIAAERKLTLRQLARANPGVDFQHLKAGDTLALPGSPPPLTVVAWKEVLQTPEGGAPSGPQMMRVTYENGAKVEEEVIGPPPRSGAGAGRTGPFTCCRHSTWTAVVASAASISGLARG